MHLPSLGLRTLFFLPAIVCLWVAAAGAATRHVNVGQGGGLNFVDVISGTSTTTINVGDTVEWDWQTGFHSTTSGSCPGNNCSPDHSPPTWDSPEQGSGTFSHTFTSPGTFTYYCRIHLAAMQGTVIVNAAAPPADFVVSISNPIGGSVGGPIFPSQQTTFNGMLTPLNGYNKTVNLTCQPGMTAVPSVCSPSPASPMVSASTPFSITAGSATPGHYDFMIQASDGTNTHTVSGLSLDVVDFNIAAPSPSSVTVFSNPSSTSISTLTSITLSAAGSYSTSMALGCTAGLPTGATCNFTPSGLYMPAANNPIPVTATITIPAATAAQDYNVTLSATSTLGPGPVTKTQSLPLHVVQFAASAFSPGAVTIGTGNVSNAATANISASTSSASVSLACTAGLPAGGACNFSPANVTGPFPVPASITVSVPANTASGSSALTVTATGNLNGASASQTLPLTLSVPPPGFFFGTPSSASVSMVNNSFSSPVTVQITPMNFAGAVTLSCGSLPAGVSCLFSPSNPINLNAQPINVSVVFEANGATPATLNNININGAATVNSNPVNASVGLTQLAISDPASSTNIASTLAAVNLVTNSALTNVGDPNLAITASVDNTGSTYSAAVWEVNFSSPVSLVAASNAQCTQVTSTAVTCAIGDVPVGNGNSYSFKVAPAFARSLEVKSLLTSPAVGSSNLAGNFATATVQVRVRPLARKGLVPKVP
ncbi:MAG TPA: hypothetical protein VK699_03275 [Terriglobales bacterium]|jgi:plastocyanin|nr:hypothetical protein [Terriglobales bacterium]